MDLILISAKNVELPTFWMEQLALLVQLVAELAHPFQQMIAKHVYRDTFLMTPTVVKNVQMGSLRINP